MAEIQPLVVLNIVGLTPELLTHAPNLRQLAESGKSAPLEGAFPGVTMTAQASMLTGATPDEHGIVGNGWFWRDTGEVRFWLQANALLRCPPFYQTARERAQKRGAKFTTTKMFWWFNQGAAVDYSVTPKPYYGADGSKAFAIQSSPENLAQRLERAHGPFPFFSFWGPKAGLPASEWIAVASVDVIRTERPTLTLVYLPHLDYDLQRCGPSGCDLPKLVGEVDRCAGLVIEAARGLGAKVLAVSEYGINDVKRAVLPNRALREKGYLAVRDGPFGETIDTFGSRAFAVCDHQIAHVYVRDPKDRDAVAASLRGLAGVGHVLDWTGQEEFELAHQRCGDFVLMSEPDAWFAYPYWLDDGRAPDFARTVDIHRKPGYDPCELFVDPALAAPKLRVAMRLLQKKLGMRYLMDVVPLDPSLVKGSHGLPASEPSKGPLIISSDALVVKEDMALTDVHDVALKMLGLEGAE